MKKLNEMTVEEISGLTPEEIYDMSCTLVDSIIMPDGKELCNPTPVQEILNTENRYTLKERVARCLRNPTYQQIALIRRMNELPDPKEENDFDCGVEEGTVDPLTQEQMQVVIDEKIAAESILKEEVLRNEPDTVQEVVASPVQNGNTQADSPSGD